jgi:L-alanine-DL-glutamate epimerase-like enolase superfamily enzyme
VVELDIQHLGLTGSQRAAEAAFGFELPVMLAAAPGNVEVHLAGALPNLMAVEVTAVSAAGVGSDISFADGRAVAGDRSGLGLRVGRESRREILARVGN